MGITAGGNGNGGGNGGFGNSPFGRRRRLNGTISEMNVVPLVDVVLVLLIIFMLTAHVMEFGLEVEVPRVRTVRNTAEELPVVTLTKEGEVYLAEKPVNINQLVAAIKAKYPDQQGVYIRADKNVIWEPMANVISVLGDGKFAVRMVTQPIEDGPRRGR